MQDWKIRQELYHRLNREHRDDLKQFDVQITEDIVGDAVKYFKDKDVGWLYPAKSYMVGICYSKWLSDEFGGEPLEYLNDEDLLYGNDPYFVTYKEDSITYNEILNMIGGWNFDFTGIVPDVKEYFNDEFMIESSQYGN
jgi:hypothetical protein